MGIETRLEQLLDELRTPYGDGSFHRAAGSAPAVVSAWDSAHAALAQMTRDPAGAHLELQTLYAFCGRSDGLLAAERAIDAQAAEQRAAEIGEVSTPTESRC